ncbi:MAG: sulfate/thiosulfate transport system substrate-binding protein [Gaiellaceae bacterium]|jgi:sulfate transport system substrate-binding protein|nr:sulfate/thiosulfate transport system substrate-binding protein [Gaiellaceae bacterium]MDX6471973.1 sulfate/thiosulfate transport system substrate-binding protein [Gaiellaceae bacterium]
MRRSLALIALSTALVATSAASAATGRSSDTTLSVVGYSIPTAVFPKLTTAYQATPAGNGVKFTSSFAASEVQSKAVAAGLPADVVNLSISTDVDRLVSAGLVDKSWDKNAYHGIVSKSVVVFVLRNGNPKHIKTWDDLVKPGVDVVFPNPFSSGGARWDVMAAYGAQLRAGKTPAQAQAYLKTLFQHNVSQDTSGRNALNTFLSGKGDVLLDYESDAKLAQSQGKPVYYLIPKATLQIETPLAVVNGSNKAEAQKFASWLYTPAAQTIWADNGFRPVVLSVLRKYAKQFPPRPQLFKIGYVGGWDKVNTQFFDPTNGIVAKIEQSLGVTTGG